jgi:hypothetical protein
MTEHSTKTAAVAAGAMLFGDWFDPIEDAREGGRRREGGDYRARSRASAISRCAGTVFSLARAGTSWDFRDIPLKICFC